MHRKRILITLVLGIAALAGCHKGDAERRIVVDEKYVHAYGMELQANDWETRGQSGQVIATLDNGIVVSKQFLAGTLEGETTYSYPHSSVVEHVDNYEGGVVTKTVYNDSTGQPRKEICYRGNDLRAETSFYETLAPRWKETFQGDFLTSGEYYTLESKLESKIDNGSGVKILRNDEGELTGEALYESGKLLKETHLYPNGNPREIISIRNGLPDGIKRTYLINGEPNTIEEWSAGYPNGKTIVFKNGDKYAEIPYVKGRKQGVEVRYKDGQEIAEEITWENDKMHGPYHSYFGPRVKTEWYISGQRVTKALLEQPR